MEEALRMTSSETLKRITESLMEEKQKKAADAEAVEDTKRRHSSANDDANSTAGGSDSNKDSKAEDEQEFNAKVSATATAAEHGTSPPRGEQ